MINCIPPAERLITVERSLELGLRRHPELHPDVVELEEVLPDADGNGGLTIRDLVRRTRRHNPSRVLRRRGDGPGGGRDAQSAMSQGNNGSLSTIHARSATDVFAKLATYAAQYEHLDFAVAHSLIAERGRLRGVHREEPVPGRPAVRDRGPGGRRRPGRPGGQRR